MPFERALLDAVTTREYARAALVTLVALEGSGYQRAGARMLVFDDGSSVGSVTGGCLERSVIEKTLAGIQTDETFTFTVDTTSDADAVFGYGLGCAGKLTLEVEPFRNGARPAAIEAALRVNATRQPETFKSEVLQPSPHMLVVGMGNDSQPIVSIARASGFDVMHVKRVAGAAFPRDRRSVAVLVTHNLLTDLETARELVKTDMPYIGIVGSRKRFAWLREELEKEHAPTWKLSGPAGVAIGAQTPAEIALSIVAEASAALSVRVVPIILAAGAATRFGSPKQLALVNGQTLIHKAITNFGAPQSRCGAPIVVTGANAQAVAAEIAGQNAFVVHNADWQTGLASSIKAGVSVAEKRGAEAVLVMACDQAAITPRDIEDMVALWDRSPERIATAEYEGIAGVPAIFPREHFAALLSLRGDEGARQIIRTATDPVRVPMPNAALDVDTPADLTRAL